jgi:hypothetical protein
LAPTQLPEAAELHDVPNTPDAVALQPDPEELVTVTSETASSSADAEAQTCTATPVDVSTQTTETKYPKFWDDAGRINNELRCLKAAMKAFDVRMGSLRTHMEARLEISTLTEKLREFLTFHRHQISRYLEAIVAEGHRAAVKDELRNSSNECVMPLLGLMDRFRELNQRVGRNRGRLDVYGSLLAELEEVKGHLELVRFIEPCQLLD